MAREATIDWNVLIQINGVVVVENDVRVSGSVHNDGTVMVDDIRLIEWDTETGRYLFKPFDKNEPFHIAVYDAMKAALEANAAFCERACYQVGWRYVGQGSNDPDGHYVMVGE
jgi:hypothetical protein